jgi:uncharacterized repeat protein (TIGR01451 family)
VVINFGTLGNGARATAAINVNPTLEGSINATATASANQIDPVSENNTATANVVVGPSTDLAVGIISNPNPVVLRSNLTYTISVTNRGPSVATSVVVNDILPAGVSLVSSNTTIGTLAGSGSTVTCNLGTMTNGATATITLVVRSANPGTLVNSVNVSGAQTDPDTGNNSASAITVVATPFVNIAAAGATLTSESFSPPNGTIDVGESVTLQLRLRNIGNVPNTNLVATLLSGNGVTSPSGPQTYAILAPSGFPVARAFSFTASGVNGGVVVATLQVQDAGGYTTNISFSFALPSVVTFSNANRIDIPTTLQDQQSPGPASPYPSSIAVGGVSGLVGKVTATVHNLTHSFPHDINLLLVGPSGASAVLMSHSGDGSSVTGAEVSFDDAASGPLPASGQIVSGAYQPTAYDAAPVFTNPAPAGPYSAALSVFNGPTANGAWALYANDDSSGDFGNIAGGWSLTITTLSPVNQVADLASSSISIPTTVLVGNRLTNTFTLSNTGPNNVAAAAFTNIVPANASLVSAGVTQGVIVTNDNTLVFSLGGISSGSNAVVTVILTATSAGSVTNSGVIAAASGEIDLNLANNSVAAVVTAVQPQTDIAIANLISPNPVTTGSNFTASITVTNLGANNALNVLVSNTLPAGTTFLSTSSSQGSASNFNGTVVGDLGTIPAGGSASVNFTVTANTPGLVTNVARASTLSIDGNASNDSIITVVTIADPAPAILAVGATLTGESFSPANAAVDPGETVTLSLTLTNAGSANTTSLVATLLAANGVTAPGDPVAYGALIHGGAAVSRSFTFTAANSGSGVSATLQLQDGASNLGTVTFTFPYPATATFTNSLGIIIPDHGPANPYPSTIAISGLTGTVSKVTLGLNALSHSFPRDVNIVLVNPSGAKVSIMSHTGGGHVVTNLNLTFDDSAPLSLPDSATLTSGTFKPTAFAPSINFPLPAPAGPAASALSAFNGSNPNGNWSLFVVDDSNGDAGSIAGGWTLSVTTVSTVGPAVNLVATLTDSPDPVFVGSVLTYNLTLTNLGPSTATGVLFTDNLPPGVILVSSNTSAGSFSLVGGGMTINAGSLAPGAGLAATIRVSPSAAGTITNVVTASAAQTDLDLASNIAKSLTTVVSPQPAQLTIQSAANQQYQITVTAEPGQVYSVQGATNLVNWTPIFTGTAAANGTFKFNTTNAQSFNYRFFRSVRIP